MRTCTYPDHVGERLVPDEAFYPYDLAAGRTKCRACKLLYVQKRYQQRIDERRCYYCGCSLTKTDKRLCKKCKAARREAWNTKFKEPQRLYAKRRRLGLKLSAMEAYGGSVCKCCGETKVEFLSIDHINGDGADHRRKLGKRFSLGHNFYQWLRDNNYPHGFQVLCMNCNFAKGHFGECPHETERRLKEAQNGVSSR